MYSPGWKAAGSNSIELKGTFLGADMRGWGDDSIENFWVFLLIARWECSVNPSLSLKKLAPLVFKRKSKSS